MIEAEKVNGLHLNMQTNSSGYFAVAGLDGERGGELNDCKENENVIEKDG